MMAADPTPAISMCRLTKRFLSTLALDHIDLTIERGAIHALVGENGAGKSTLIKTLAGLYQPDEGEIRIDGKLVQPSAETVPISFVHQDLGLVDDLSIGENVALIAGFPRRYGFISWKRVWTQAQDIYVAMGIDAPDPRALVGRLSAASKSVLGIARALSQKASIVASLPGPDAQHLFDVLKRLRAPGTSILYVSHRLNELFGLVDKVTVLRDGRHVRSSSIGTPTPDMIVRDTLGQDLELHYNSAANARQQLPLLDVVDLCAGGQGPLSFSVAAGEIVGLVGLRGAGHEAIGRSIFGVRRQGSASCGLAAKKSWPI
jgi:ribose transport system ATP-binding protein